MADWFCNIADKIDGPMTAAQLKAAADAGQVAPNDLVGQSAEGPWVPARRVRGLFSSTPATPIPKPPVVEPDDPFGIVTGDASPTARFTGRKVRKKKKAPEPRRPRTPLEKQKRLVLILVLMLVGGSVAGGGLIWWRSRPPAAAGGVTDPFAARTIEADTVKPIIEDIDLGTLGLGGRPAAGEASHPDLSLDTPGEAVVAVAAGGTLKVAITSVEAGRPRLIGSTDRAAQPKNHYLLIRLKLHTDEAGRRFPYRSWGSGGGASLRDESGHEYRLKTPTNFHEMRIEGQVDGMAVIESDPVHDLLVFEPPEADATLFYLRLAASALDAEEELRFEIPRSEIEFADDFQFTADKRAEQPLHDEAIRVPGLTYEVGDDPTE